MTAQELQSSLREIADAAVAEHSQSFFKTGKGEYGEGDRFLGIRVPELRKHAGRCSDLELREIATLLESEFHEERLLALFILVKKFARAGSRDRKNIYNFYLRHKKRVNNWDLVDSSAHQIVGAYLAGKDRKPLYKLAHSKNIWERRIAIIATYHFIKRDDFDDALAISTILLNDDEDLIHKAVGWMLREIGKKQREVENEFLQQHYATMPRTMLRYAIEKHPENERQAYLKGIL